VKEAYCQKTKNQEIEVIKGKSPSEKGLFPKHSTEKCTKGGRGNKGEGTWGWWDNV